MAILGLIGEPYEVLAGIQYLRAVAALLVMLHHATDKAGMGWVLGAAGVDVFFVISGFIMCLITGAAAGDPRPVFWRTGREADRADLLAGDVGDGHARGPLGLFPNLKLTIAHVMASLFFIPMRSPANGRNLAGPRAGMDAELRDVLLRGLRRRTAAQVEAGGPDGGAGRDRRRRGRLAGRTVRLAVLRRPHRAGVRGRPGWARRGEGRGWRLPAWTGVVAILAGVVGFAVLPADGERIFVWGVPALLIVAGGLIDVEPLLPRLKALLLVDDGCIDLPLAHHGHLGGRQGAGDGGRRRPGRWRPARRCSGPWWAWPPT